MAGPTLTAAALAEELGRSESWVHANWHTLVRERRMPAPLHDTPPMVWSRAQIYAWLDRDLERPQRIAAAAYRAAAAAAADARHINKDDLAVAEWRGKLDRRFTKGAA